MKRTELLVRGAGSREQLLPRLRGRAFHVTCAANLENICQRAAVLTNEDGALTSAFGFYPNAFFRNRGCVSVFDFRSISEEDLDHAIMACSPWQPAESCGGRLAFLFLDETARSRLRPWIECKASASVGEMLVPFAEAGYPGPIPIGSIEEILEVLFERGEEHPFLAALRSRPGPPPL